MRKLSFLAGAIVFAAILSTSCKKDDPVNPPVIQVNVYTAGNEYESSTTPVPVIYKDSDELYRMEKGSTVSGVAFIGGDVYACGTSAENHPVLWKNGKSVNSALTALTGTLSDMANDGTNWFCCGDVEVDGKTYGIITKNGEEVFRSKDPDSFVAIDLGASGNCYVVEKTEDNVNLLRVDASKSELLSTTLITGDLRFVPTDIYVGLQDICVSLNLRTVDRDNAYCWISTTSDSLIGLCDSDSFAECVAIYNGYVITGGYIVDKSGNTVATQWTNAYAEDYSYGCNPGSSSVKLLLNGGYNLYEAVQSPGQIQICCNGALIGTINCNNTFDATAWDIIRI